MTQRELASLFTAFSLAASATAYAAFQICSLAVRLGESYSRSFE